MTRYQPGHKEETRQRILDAAARLFRREGYAASGVAKVMEAAELTVGGFYAHFDSKEALLAEVLARSVEQTKALLFAGLEDVHGAPFAKEVVRRYLSRAHRDLPADGCALPALATEVSRQGDKTRETFEEYFEKMIADFQGHLPDKDTALALCSLCVGGMIFARAVKNKDLSDRILAACKKFATASLEAR